MSTAKSPTPESKRTYVLKVNGVSLSTEHELLTAAAILILAVDHNAISGKPDEYLLDGPKGIYQLGDVIDLREENVFIAIPDKSTPVAEPHSDSTQPCSPSRTTDV